MRKGHPAFAHRACRSPTFSRFIWLQRLDELPQGLNATRHRHVRRLDHRRGVAVQIDRLIDIYLLYSLMRFYASIYSAAIPTLWGSWHPQFNSSHRRRVIPVVAVDHIGLSET
jgi:hypothetical protein